MTHESAEHADVDVPADLPIETATMAHLPGDVVVDRIRIGQGIRFRVSLHGELIRDYEQRGDALLFIHRWMTVASGASARPDADSETVTRGG